MKTATQNLMSDHDNILQLIEVMYIMAEQKSTSTDDIATVIAIIKNYADGFHHAKEENLLFPSMIEKGFSQEQGPIAVMLHDHSLGRQYVQGMNTGMEQYKSGDNHALNLVYENMCNYGQLLQSHIAKENNVLFKMADKAFSEDDQEHLLSEFEKIEANEAYGANIPNFLKAIDNLKMLYKR